MNCPVMCNHRPAGTPYHRSLSAYGLVMALGDGVGTTQVRDAGNLDRTTAYRKSAFQWQVRAVRNGYIRLARRGKNNVVMTATMQVQIDRAGNR